MIRKLFIKWTEEEYCRTSRSIDHNTPIFAEPPVGRTVLGRRSLARERDETGGRRTDHADTADGGGGVKEAARTEQKRSLSLSFVFVIQFPARIQ